MLARLCQLVLLTIVSGLAQNHWENEFEPPQPEEHMFEPTLPTSGDVIYGHFKRAVRFLMGNIALVMLAGDQCCDVVVESQAPTAS